MSSHRDDWVRNIHRPYRWFCNLRHSTAHIFESDQLLRKHLHQDHTEHLSNSRIDLIVAKSTVPVPLAAHVCPFCGENVAIESPHDTNEDNPRLSDPTTDGSKLTYLHGQPVPMQKPKSPNTSIDVISEPAFTARPDLDATTAHQKKDSLSLQMVKHIADHLESVALWSLRWWDEDSGISQETDEGSCNPEDRMSFEALSQGDIRKFEHRLFDCFAPSQFPVSGEKFLPANIIEDVVTIDDIVELLPGILESTRGAALTRYIIQSAKRVFLITALHCHFDSERLIEAMAQFEMFGFKDSSLPLGNQANWSVDTYSAFHSSTTVEWGDAKLTTFYRSQWKYLAPVFSRDNFTFSFSSEHRMPFISVEPRNLGIIPAVLEAIVHEAHFKITYQTVDPRLLVDYLTEKLTFSQ